MTDSRLKIAQLRANKRIDLIEKDVIGKLTRFEDLDEDVDQQTRFKREKLGEE